MELKQHPLSAAFPAMGAEDFAALVEDIRINGQREPVIVFESMVLDGWHRYSACVQLGIKAQRFTFESDKDPVAFVLSQNLHRRHLTGSQRAAAVVACTEWAPASRPKKGEPGSPISTNEALAKAANVSDRTIKDAKAAHRAGLGEAVKEGALTAKEAANVARGKTAPSPEAKQAPTPPPASATADDAFDGFDPIAELESTQKLLEAAEKRIESLTADDIAAELNKQVGIRQGIEARLSLEMKKVGELQKELDSYGKWYAELRKASGLEKRSEITKLVREAANNRSEAV